MIKNPCIRMAFYGKGGIGKSTIASNVAAGFSSLGLKVLLIGCDPKGDSTRNIMGKKIPTVIHSILEKGENLQEQDFIKIGFNGIHCIETGGPEPGVGCAGRGIITMMEELKNHNVLQRDWDVIIFDVLGDVVCGGFSVPMREQYVDAVYIVSSSEFMSIYAANNIMKSIKRFSENQPPFFGGIIHNQRNDDSRDYIIDRFAKETLTEVLSKIPYSDEIALSELQALTVIEKTKESEVAGCFIELAKRILNQTKYTIPNPLNEQELELFSKQIIEIKLQERSKHAKTVSK